MIGSAVARSLAGKAIAMPICRLRVLVGVALLGGSIFLGLATVGGRACAKEPAATAPRERAKKGVARDWKRSPAIVQIHAHGDIAAIGDVHGDYPRLVKLLAAARLIAATPSAPDQVRWTGKRTVLVCTGDLIDKGDRALDVLACFRALRPQAAAAGGAVIVTMGNHEAEFLADPHNKKSADFRAELRREKISPEDVADAKDRLELGKLLRGLPFAARVDDWFFAHACCTEGRTLARLDRQLAEEVSEDGFAAHVLLGKCGLLEARLEPRPWWERDGDTSHESKARLREYADALAIRHFVMGHQAERVHFADGSHRKAGEMFEKYDGLMFLIDVGMSGGQRSEGALLLIHRTADGELAVALDAAQNRTPLWHSMSVGVSK